MADARIINPGLMTTIQDLGRFGFQQYGIPVSGAMDKYSLELANILVGNNRDAAGLEITLTGPTIEFGSSMAIAITGADISPMLNGNSVDMYKTVFVHPGDVLSFGGIKSGSRAYLAMEGGIDVPSVMGSKSTYLKAGIGGLGGKKLLAGDTLKAVSVTREVPIGIRKIPDNLIPRYHSEISVRVILGPEDTRFTSKGVSAFLENEYTVTNQSDRMGLRLQGPKIEHINGPDILSSGISLGTIQVAGDGQPIVLMADRQTTGGYTRIASVISVDITYLAQAKPGERIRFQSISIETAQQLLREREADIVHLAEEYDRESHQMLSARREFRIRVNDKTYEVSVMEMRK